MRCPLTWTRPQPILQPPEGRLVGGEVAVRGAEVALQLD